MDFWLNIALNVAGGLMLMAFIALFMDWDGRA